MINGGGVYSAGFTYRLDRLKPRAITFRGPPSKVCNISNTVIGRPHLCCHNVLYFLSIPIEASVLPMYVNYQPLHIA
jgi:hypothetical protein